MHDKNLPTIIIFGFGPNLGAAIAKKLLNNNYRVLGINRSGESYGVSHLNFECKVVDLSKPRIQEILIQLLSEVKNLTGIIFNLSNFAAISIKDMNNQDLEEAFKTSLYLLNTINKIFFPTLLKLKGASILTSNATSDEPWLKFPTMGISKAAIENYQKALAKDNPEARIYTLKICSAIKDNKSKGCADIAQVYLELLEKSVIEDKEIIIK